MDLANAWFPAPGSLIWRLGGASLLSECAGAPCHPPSRLPRYRAGYLVQRFSNLPLCCNYLTRRYCSPAYLQGSRSSADAQNQSRTASVNRHSASSSPGHQPARKATTWSQTWVFSWNNLGFSKQAHKLWVTCISFHCVLTPWKPGCPLKSQGSRIFVSPLNAYVNLSRNMAVDTCQRGLHHQVPDISCKPCVRRQMLLMEQNRNSKTRTQSSLNDAPLLRVRVLKREAAKSTKRRRRPGWQGAFVTLLLKLGIAWQMERSRSVQVAQLTECMAWRNSPASEPSLSVASCKARQPVLRHTVVYVPSLQPRCMMQAKSQRSDKV